MNQNQLLNLDEESLELFKKLSDKEWRLNNLYKIIDEAGNIKTFKFNVFQRNLFDHLWYLNIILKARQHGITTFVSLFILDSVLFENNKNALIIAHTLGDAEAIFTNKIKFAFDNLPSWLKPMFEVNSDSARELRFNNGSSIRVDTSGRSGTFQYLHITEFGIMCLKYPEKSKEIISGSLNAVHAGQMIFIEATAKGQEGKFYEMCRQAMNIKFSGAPLTMLDYKFFFYSWWENPKYQIEGDISISREYEEYFNSLEIMGIKLSRQQKNWYIKKKEIQEEEMFSEYPSTPEEAFKASIEGSYYGREIEIIIKDKKITKVPWTPHIMVDTYWDLGMNDMTSIIFVQQFNQEIRIIDCYQNHGEGILHYVRYLKSKPYIYEYHFGPHDLKVRELGTGKSRWETAVQMGLNFQITPLMPISDGIEAVRNVLPRCWFDEEKTVPLVKALKNYRKEWDDNLGTFKSKPLHDKNSHLADAMRYLATSLPYGGRYTPDAQKEFGRSKEDMENDEGFNKHGIISSF